MVIAGALLAFEGLRELFMLVPPRLREAASHAEEVLAEAREEVARGEGLRMLVRHALVGLLVVGLHRRRDLLHAQPRGAARDARLHGRLQRRPRAVRPPARRGRLPRRPQLDVGRRVRRLDVPEPGAGLRLAPRPRHPGAAVRRALRNAHRRPRQDRPRRTRRRRAAKFEKADRQGGRRRGDAHPRPAHRAAHRPARRLPLPRLLRARGRAARRRCSRACGTSSSRTRARCSSS